LYEGSTTIGGALVRIAMSAADAAMELNASAEIARTTLRMGM
jgi:hypothetical protein